MFVETAGLWLEGYNTCIQCTFTSNVTDTDEGHCSRGWPICALLHVYEMLWCGRSVEPRKLRLGSADQRHRVAVSETAAVANIIFKSTSAS